MITYVVLGDSTAAGEGGTYEKGIAVSTARELASRGLHVRMTNLAISGARSKDVVALQMEEAERLAPDLVLLAVGANDVTHLTSIRSMRRSVRESVRRLRSANPAVEIVVTGSPDMGAPPRVPRLLRGIAACRTNQANRMFRTLAEEERLLFAPIAEETGPLFRADRSLFAADQFHPNDRGYSTWTPVLTRALADAVARMVRK